MYAHNAYRKNVQTAWTRVDMLLALYDSTIQCLDDGIDLLNRGDLVSYPAVQIKVTERILYLVDGINLESGSVASNIHDLCVFCIGQIATPTVESWVSAREVMATLREGFQAIREEAIQLEATGAIPPLSMSSTQTIVHA